MIAKPSDRSLAGSRKFIPEVKPLESRLLLSRTQTVSFPDGATVVFPTFGRLPRTGGVFAQAGSVLSIGVGQRTANNVRVTENGSGVVTAEWNRQPTHVLTGVDPTVIQMRSAGMDQVTINLTSLRTAPAGVAAASLVRADGAPARGHADLTATNVRRTSGAAVQSGSVLTITVSARTTNSVEISNEGAGAVLVEWNHGVVHSFAGVETIVVDTRNATNDLVALHDATG
jgi:hypothetical protein